MVTGAAVTPLGSPVAATVTAPLYPPVRVMVRGIVPEPPCTTESAEAPAVMVMACGVIARAKVPLADATPEPDAVITTLPPAVAALPTAMVAVEAVDPLPSDAGLKVTVTPLGAVAARLTVPV